MSFKKRRVNVNSTIMHIIILKKFKVKDIVICITRHKLKYYDAGGFMDH